MRLLIATIVIASALPLTAQTTTPMWVEMTGTGPSVRAIVASGEPCPVATAGGVKLPLQERVGAKAADAAFPVKACAAQVPAGVHEVHIGDRVLHTFGAQLPVVNRIVVIGDTGCRRSETETQDCEKDWPFAKIVGFAAARKPDLVVHVGDYYYREICADGAKHCESWENWRKDFFTPAAPLFATAPWLMARGNHEMCGRASEGWFRFLDAGATPLTCPAGVQTESAPFAVPLHGLTLVSVDSADTPDADPVQKKIAGIAGQIAKAAPTTGSPVWVVTHKPPYEGGLSAKAGESTGAPKAALPGVQMFLVGHIHMFGAIDFGGVRPDELIVGDSGTKLQANMARMDALMARADPLSLIAGEMDIDGKLATFSAKGRFGYMLLERTAGSKDAWHGTLYGTADEVLAQCTLTAHALGCVAPTK
jgi:hypothetical protein